MSIPIVFLHGWAMNGAAFDNVANLLGSGFDCHAPDLPGHGTRQNDVPSLDRCVEVTNKLIGQLDRPIIVGWSMGAAVAWRYLERHGSAALRGLVTIDMSPRLLPDRDWPFGLRGQTKDAVLATSSKIESKWQPMVDGILRNMYAPGSTLAAKNEAMKTLLLSQDPAKLRPLWDDLVANEARQTIAKIGIPYLVCAGAQSRLYSPELAEWIANHAPQAEVHLFGNSGHSPHLEEPEAFCAAIKRFASNHFGASVGGQKGS